MVNVVSPRCDHSDHDWQRVKDPYEIGLGSFVGDNGERLCWAHYYQDSRNCRAIRREKIYLGHLITILPGHLNLTHAEFEEYYIGNDFTLSSCQLKRRPDMLFNFPKCAVLLEFDENGHRNRDEMGEMSHLTVIQQWCADRLGKNNLYVFRINPDGIDPMSKKGTVLILV